MARNKDKFFIYAAKKSGYLKNKRLLGVNHRHAGAELTLQDLLDFLREKNVDPSSVIIFHNFTTYAKED